MKKGLWSFFAVSSFLLFSYSCKDKKSDEKEEASTYVITQALQKDTNITKDYIAQIQSLKNIELRAQEKGFLQNIYVDEGQYVHQGQVLFRIMPQLYEAEVMKAKAEVEQAKIELQNASKLANNNVVSKSEKAMAKAKLDASLAELKLAQIHLNFTYIKAPFSGIINRIPKKLGSLVDEGELLTTLSDNSGIYAYFNVSEPEYLNYQTHAEENKNKSVSLIMANGDISKDKGYIQNIEGEFDNETGNIAFRAKFPNTNQLLRNGQTGKVRMEIPLKNALIIPQKSTYEIQDKKYVFVIDNHGIAHSRNINIAYELPDVYVIDSGLNPNEKFLVDGVQKVKDDDKVKVKYENPQQVIQSLKLKAN